MRDKITVIGSLNYDVILKIARLPEMGETFHADDVAFSAGGKGANQAVQAAKLGVPTYMIGCVGKDPNGEILISEAKKYGVNTERIRRVEEPTGMGVVNALQDGSVFAVIVKGANYAVTKEDIDHAEDLLKESAIVILQMEIPQEINMYAIDKAKEAGCKVLLNAAPAADIPEAYLKKVDILVVNEVEAAFYLHSEVDTVEKAKENALKMSAELGNACIFTLGKEGSVVASAGEVTFIPSKKVDAVESTGAGDSFIGAVGYALIHGMNIVNACEFATGCSAITVCRYGAQPSMPTLEEVNMQSYL